jgi:hypothetical protein
MIGVTPGTGVGRAARQCGGVCIVSCATLLTPLAALADLAGRGCGGSRRPRRIHHPRRQIEIIVGIGRWPIMPILQTMFGSGRTSGCRDVSMSRAMTALSLPGFGLLAVPLTGLYVAAAPAQEVGPCATQPYRLHRSRKRHHLTAVQAVRWIGKTVHRSGLPDPRPSDCAQVLTPA